MRMTAGGGALVFVAKPSGRIFLKGSELAANRGFYLRSPYPAAIS